MLHATIAAVRALAGRWQFAFTDAIAAAVPIRSLHLTKMRTAIDAAHAALAMSPAVYYENVTPARRVTPATWDALR